MNFARFRLISLSLIMFHTVIVAMTAKATSVFVSGISGLVKW